MIICNPLFGDLLEIDKSFGKGFYLYVDKNLESVKLI